MTSGVTGPGGTHSSGDPERVSESLSSSDKKTHDAALTAFHSHSSTGTGSDLGIRAVQANVSAAKRAAIAAFEIDTESPREVTLLSLVKKNVFRVLKDIFADLESITKSHPLYSYFCNSYNLFSKALTEALNCLRALVKPEQRLQMLEGLHESLEPLDPHVTGTMTHVPQSTWEFAINKLYSLVKLFDKK